jgi:hypothetical protein
MTLSSNEDFAEQKEFRVVLILPWSKTLLVRHHDQTHRLPRFRIPKWTGVAQQLTEVVQEKWAVCAIVVDLLPESNKRPPCVVFEVRSPGWKLRDNGFISIQVDDLDNEELTGTERVTVRSIIAGDAEGRGPFSRLGWIDDAQEWIRRSVYDHQVEFNGDTRQSNASGSFALVRFGTLDGPTYWLKATGASNAHEREVTQALARYCTEFLPPLIAARTDWNAWITEEAGEPLDDAPSLNALEESTRCLAGVQIRSADHIEDLLACGCFDQRLPSLRASLPELMQYLEGAMARQAQAKLSRSMQSDCMNLYASLRRHQRRWRRLISRTR